MSESQVDVCFILFYVQRPAVPRPDPEACLLEPSVLADGGPQDIGERFQVWPALRHVVQRPKTKEFDDELFVARLGHHDDGN